MMGKPSKKNEAYTVAACDKDMRMLCRDAPEDFGLFITLKEGEPCRLTFVPDQHMDEVHPNAYGPASLSNLKILAGGGSGVTVFSGSDCHLGNLVMKHGGDKDTKELFALATIAGELQKRRSLTPGAADAAEYMKDRLPEFRGVYISPQHISTTRPTSSEYWKKTFAKVSASLTRRGNPGKASIKPNRIRFLSYPSFLSDRSAKSTLSSSTQQQLGALDELGDSTTPDTLSPNAHSAATSQNGESPEDRVRRIWLFWESNDAIDAIPHRDQLEILLGKTERIDENTATSLLFGPKGMGFDCLNLLSKPLQAAQKERNWKFTLAQKQIGGKNPKTAAKWLTEGELEGEILQTLIREEIKVVRNLERLTSKEEASSAVAKQVRDELDTNYRDVFFSPSNISDAANEFVGLAIKKNWDPNSGRFFVLRRMGEAFRKQTLTLTREESIPASCLGKILQEGALMADVFEGTPAKLTALECKGCAPDTWRNLLEDAVSLKSEMALKPIWNSGLSDGGIHNMFLSEDGINLFDIGEPTFQPVPAFLTKFLFSFLHVLGMEDDKERGTGWVNRFNVPPVLIVKGKLTLKDKGKLSLTEKTQKVLPKAYAALHTALDRIVEELFDREEEVRELLMHYITLQLLSDAAFCLERWAAKGGGQSRQKNHQQHLEDWLWRSLWDIYIASDLNLVSQKRYLGGRRRSFKLLKGLSMIGSWGKSVRSVRNLFDDASSRGAPQNKCESLK